MLNKIISYKYFWHIVIVIIILIAVYVYVNRKRKDEQFELFLQAINDPSTISGESSDVAKYSNAWDTSYYKKVTGAKLLPKTSLDFNVDKIKNAKSIVPFNNNDNAIIGVFNGLTYKTQVSQLSDAFKNKYKQDLLDFIKDTLKNQNLELVLSKVSNLK